MKKYSLIVIIISVLLLTGCGKSHTLICKSKSATQERTAIIEFNSDNTEIENVIMDVILDLGTDTSSDLLNHYKESMETNCVDNSFKKCEVTISDGKVLFHAEGKPELLGFESDATIDETKETTIRDGYDCD